jgi:hypothetical protein
LCSGVERVEAVDVHHVVHGQADERRAEGHGDAVDAPEEQQDHERAGQHAGSDGDGRQREQTEAAEQPEQQGPDQQHGERGDALDVALDGGRGARGEAVEPALVELERAVEGAVHAREGAPYPGDDGRLHVGVERRAARAEEEHGGALVAGDEAPVPHREVIGRGAAQPLEEARHDLEGVARRHAAQHGRHGAGEGGAQLHGRAREPGIGNACPRLRCVRRQEAEAAGLVQLEEASLHALGRAPPRARRSRRPPMSPAAARSRRRGSRARRCRRPVRSARRSWCG